MTYWIKDSSWKDKRRARTIARMLRAPGEHRVRARIVRETYWRVEFTELKKEIKRP